MLILHSSICGCFYVSLLSSSTTSYSTNALLIQLAEVPPSSYLSESLQYWHYNRLDYAFRLVIHLPCLFMPEIGDMPDLVASPLQSLEHI